MSEKKKALFGFGAVFGGMALIVAIMIASTDRPQSHDRTMNAPSASEASTIKETDAGKVVSDEKFSALQASRSVANVDSNKRSKTIAEASDEEKIFLMQNDPDMKRAGDAVGAIINLSGYLCSQVFYVEPAAGGKFKVDCVKHKNRSVKVRYLVDGATNQVREL